MADCLLPFLNNFNNLILFSFNLRFFIRVEHRGLKSSVDIVIRLPFRLGKSVARFSRHDGRLASNNSPPTFWRPCIVIIFQQVPHPPGAREEEGCSPSIKTKYGRNFYPNKWPKDFMKQQIQGSPIKASNRVVKFGVKLFNVVRLVWGEDLILQPLLSPRPFRRGHPWETFPFSDHPSRDGHWLDARLLGTQPVDRRPILVTRHGPSPYQTKPEVTTWLLFN